MKKVILIIMFPFILFAQYYGERTTEQSFESSNIYFESHFMNTFGLYRLQDISVGLIDDPFINLFYNPALSQQDSAGKTIIYLDFRGDRKEKQMTNGIYAPGYYGGYYDIYWPRPDPRWLTTSRTEPEPVFSLGIITTPLPEITDKWYLAATYQLIQRNEPFYHTPYGIFDSRYGYDSFGNAYETESDIPIQDRYSGSDEMINEGHLFAAYSGYQISDKLSFGLGINGVLHSRDGKYGNSYFDEFGDTELYSWNNSNLKTRNQEYNHTDINAGINYKLTDNFSAGLKAGILQGEVTQDYDENNYYLSEYNDPEISSDWSYYFSDGDENQEIDHDGNTRYYRLHFKRRKNDRIQFNGYYRFAFTDIDLKTRSVIQDTSYSASYRTYDYDSSWYESEGSSGTSDIRSGDGYRKKYEHEGAVYMNWILTPKTSVKTGFYFKHTESKVFANENVDACRMSWHEYYRSDNQYDYTYFYELIEKKRLEWRFKSKKYTIQIPVIASVVVNENWNFMIGVSKILNSWKIEDQTTAFFDLRKRTDREGTIQETNFAERYTQPVEKISEDFTDVFAGLNIKLSPQFKINLLVDPDFEETFRIVQWWLGFQAKI